MPNYIDDGLEEASTWWNEGIDWWYSEWRKRLQSDRRCDSTVMMILILRYLKYIPVMWKWIGILTVVKIVWDAVMTGERYYIIVCCIPIYSIPCCWPGRYSQYYVTGMWHSYSYIVIYYSWPSIACLLIYSVVIMILVNIRYGAITFIRFPSRFVEYLPPPFRATLRNTVPVVVTADFVRYWLRVLIDWPYGDGDCSITICRYSVLLIVLDCSPSPLLSSLRIVEWNCGDTIHCADCLLLFSIMTIRCSSGIAVALSRETITDIRYSLFGPGDLCWWFVVLIVGGICLRVTVRHWPHYLRTIWLFLTLFTTFDWYWLCRYELPLWPVLTHSGLFCGLRSVDDCRSLLGRCILPVWGWWVLRTTRTLHSCYDKLFRTCQNIHSFGRMHLPFFFLTWLQRYSIIPVNRDYIIHCSAPGWLLEAIVYHCSNCHLFYYSDRWYCWYSSWLHTVELFLFDVVLFMPVFTVAIVVMPDLTFPRYCRLLPVTVADSLQTSSAFFLAVDGMPLLILHLCIHMIAVRDLNFSMIWWWLWADCVADSIWCYRCCSCWWTLRFGASDPVIYIYSCWLFDVIPGWWYDRCGGITFGGLIYAIVTIIPDDVIPWFR